MYKYIDSDGHTSSYSLFLHVLFLVEHTPGIPESKNNRALFKQLIPRIFLNFQEGVKIKVKNNTGSRIVYTMHQVTAVKREEYWIMVNNTVETLC